MVGRPFKPLRRQIKVPVWADVALRLSAALALVFAVLSLVAWVVLRRSVGVTRAQVKVWTEDINDR